MINLPRVVAIGGGTGLATVLRGLKNYPISLSAIVTMTDNGASSGKLSRELGIQPPGDIRKCLAALASDETLLTQLFEYRFTRGRGLSGHSLGNLLLLALTEITGDFDRAIQASSQILAIKGRVIPSTLDHVSLLAQLKNSQMALGEVDIPIRGHRFGIKKITLVPERVKANPNAVRLIENADLILIGPGSLFTSVLPNFLIKDLRRAVEHSTAAKIYICNASTERGETEHFSVEDHLAALRTYLNGIKLNTVLVNRQIVEVTSEGRLGSVRNITTEAKRINGVPVVLRNLVDERQPLYHDPKKLGQAIWEIFTKPRATTSLSLPRSRRSAG